MKDEITAAVLFLIRLIEKTNQSLSREQIGQLERKLVELWTEKFRSHWHPEKPSRGQAFRCIRFNENDRRDGTLEQACRGIGVKYEDVTLPVELTLWVDPEEVTCRFGEHKGSFCVIASFRDGNKENFMDSINIEELEAKSLERAKQASFDLIRRKRQQSKNGYNKNNGACNGYPTSMSMNGMYNGLDYGSSVIVTSSSPYYSPHTTYYGSPKYGGYGSSPPQQQQQQQPQPHHSLQTPTHHNGNNNSQSMYAATGSYPMSPPNRSLNSTPYRGVFGGSNGGNGSPGLNGGGGYGGGKQQQQFSRGLNSAFSNAAMSFGSYQQTNDRYHWMNKSIVKA